MRRKILIVDDEPMMTELLSDYLGDEGYETYTAGDANEAIALLPKNPDLILLDINMPGTDGLTLCKQIREHVACPILFVTARVTEQDKVNGLQYGGDDYVTKPFGLKELSARIGAHLRRDERTGTRALVLTSGELIVNLTQHRVFYGEREIEVSKKEFDIIEFLLANAGRVFDKEHIYERLWGYDAEGSADVVKEHVRRIRAKFKEATGENYIETVWGVGYKWNR